MTREQMIKIVECVAKNRTYAFRRITNLKGCIQWRRYGLLTSVAHMLFVKHLNN